MKHILNFLTSVYKFSSEKNIQLGRWSLKTCNTAHASSFYANRDHCGDTICKMPKKYDDQPYLEKNKTKVKYR